jgi:hypothetical protein
MGKGRCLWDFVRPTNCQRMVDSMIIRKLYSSLAVSGICYEIMQRNYIVSRKKRGSQVPLHFGTTSFDAFPKKKNTPHSEPQITNQIGYFEAPTTDVFRVK